MNNLLAAIPERHTRFVQLPNEEGHNAVWDFRRSPDNRFYISICGENEKPLSALLYEYYPKSGELRLIFDVSKVWIIDAEEMPPSKIHTSIDFMPDGRLIMATHNTAPAPGHRQWLYEQSYEHLWEGFHGSILMIVNPDTNEVQVKGIPVPRESIYGGILGDDPRYYYFLGMMRGHFYRIDLETNEVIDYGKVCEYSTCRLVKDDKGRIYGSSYTGGLWRYDPGQDKVADLKVSFTSPNGTKHRRCLCYGLRSPRGTLFLVNNMDSEMIELHPETLKVTRHGHIHLRCQQPTSPYLIGGLEADENFVLYYGLSSATGEYAPMRLVRWDILNGGEPENLGLITPGGKDSVYICEMIFDRDGWLHMVEVCGPHSPYILAVDAKKLRPPGPGEPTAVITPFRDQDWYPLGRAADMHIQAAAIRTLPLHLHMNWSDTAVRHMRAAKGVLYCFCGEKQVYMAVSDYTSDKPQRIQVVYDGGAAVSCVEVDDRSVAVLTTDNRILLVDLDSATCRRSTVVPAGIALTKLLGVDSKDMLLASDREGAVYVCDFENSSVRRLENIIVQPNAYIINLDDRRMLLSGMNDDLLLYDRIEMQAVKLEVKTPAIRGRMFRATISGGVALADGTIVAGTSDGMLFSLTPDLRQTTAYGRLYSSGELRNFIKLNDSEAAGVYGGPRDAGHVFHFSRERGFVDLGRPWVLRTNAELSEVDTEWANIHYISCLTFAPEDNCLCVASGELYGCVVRYRGVAILT